MPDPSWLPDPSGRHELRWFDGVAYTDQVADGGVRSTDAGPAAAPAQPRPVEASGRASRLPLILAGLLALLVVVALVALLTRGDDGGQGTFDGEVATGSESSHTVSVGGGSVLVVEVRPGDDLDAAVELDLQGDERRRVVDLYEGTALEGELLLRRDIGFEGEAEQLLLAVPFDVDVDVVVSGFDGSEGGYEITVDVVGLEVDDDADADELFEAVLAADDVPRGLRAELEELLAG